MNYNETKFPGPFELWASSLSWTGKISLNNNKVFIRGFLAFWNISMGHRVWSQKRSQKCFHMFCECNWLFYIFLGFPGDSAGGKSSCNAGDLGSIPELGRFQGEGNSYPLEYSGFENSMDCIVQGVTKSSTQLSDFHFTSSHISNYQSDFNFHPR